MGIVFGLRKYPQHKNGEYLAFLFWEIVLIK